MTRKTSKIEQLRIQIYEEIINQGGTEEVAQATPWVLNNEAQLEELLQWLLDNRNEKMPMQMPLFQALLTAGKYRA